MLREGTRPGGICFPCSSPTARDLLFQSYWEPLRKLVSTFKVINKYTEGNVWCHPMSSWDLHEAWRMSELNWACWGLVKCWWKIFLESDVFWYMAKRENVSEKHFYEAFALASVISWYPQTGRRKRENSVRDWEPSEIASGRETKS